MTTYHAQLAAKESAIRWNELQDYANKEGMRLSRDPVEGYWLHFDGRMRFVKSLSDIRGTVDWICDGTF